MSDLTILYYYRSEDAALPEAQAKDTAEAKHIDEVAQAFASRFGASPLFDGMVVPHFVGVGFAQGQRPQHPQLWSHPKQKDPRVAPKTANFPPKLRAEAARLGREWDEYYPHEIAKPRTCHVLKELGMEIEQAVGNALQFFTSKGVSWIACSVPLDERFTEVVGSAYDRARADFRLELEVKKLMPVATEVKEAANG